MGTGYVGLVTGACFAETGNDVVSLDIDTTKVARLTKGEIPFFEPGLSELVGRNVSESRLRFTANAKEALSDADCIFICVGTPSNADGSADLTAVFAATDSIVENAKKGTVLAAKSTVPIGTGDQIRKRLDQKKRSDIENVSNPEFLREGTAVQDCLMPDRVVVGATQLEKVADLFRELYAPFVRTGNPILLMDVRSAEMTKYAANAYLAMRISFINEMAMLCERVGADIGKVRNAIGADQRIGSHYLFPSIGFGGSCFPKDVRALIAVAKEEGMDPGLLQSTLEVNEIQGKEFISKIAKQFGGANGVKGKKFGIWGLSFKAKTDDIRESPALTIVDGLLALGGQLSVYDPAAMANVQAIYGAKLTYASSAYDAISGAEGLVLCTEWNQFRHPDFTKIKSLLKKPLIFDGRNLYDPTLLSKLDFTYVSIGRSMV